MRIEMRGRDIVCTLENRNMEEGRNFLYETFGSWEKRKDDEDVLYLTYTYTARSTKHETDRVRLYAEQYGIDMSEEFVRFCETDLKEAIETEKKEEERRALEQYNRFRWGKLKQEGCLKCGYCQIIGDDNESRCLMTGKELETKNTPEWDHKEKIYRLFNWKPFPNESCPFRAE